MNRTQRAIKKKRREEQLQKKRLKQKMVFKMKNANSGGLLNHKEIAAQNVRIFFAQEKKARKDVIEYKCCAKNNLKEAVGA